MKSEILKETATYRLVVIKEEGFLPSLVLEAKRQDSLGKEYWGISKEECTHDSPIWNFLRQLFL